MALEKHELTLSDFVENFLYLNGEPFSLDNYPHMRRIYNTSADRVVLKFSRQCVDNEQLILTLNRGLVRAKDLKVRDQILGYDIKTQLSTWVYVKRVWDNGNKPVVKITTNLGSELHVTANHPVLTPLGWKLPTELNIGDAVIAYNSLNMHPATRFKKQGILDLLGFPGKPKSTKEVWDFAKKVMPADVVISDTRDEALRIKYLMMLFKHTGVRDAKQIKMYFDSTAKKWVTQLLPKSRPHYNSNYAFKIFKKHMPTILQHYPELGHFSSRANWRSLERYANTAVACDPMLKIYSSRKVMLEEIVNIENIGHRDTTAIQVTTPNTFMIEGIVTHNTAKSTTLSNILMAKAATRPNFKQLYVSPSVAQTQEFARDKLEPVILNSPLIREKFIDSKLVANVLKKQFTNGSVINLRYALLNADRIRGMSTHSIYFDETQDLLKDVIEVVEKTMTTSVVKNSYYVGTPKRTKGTLADFWFKSSQLEYAIKSSASGYWNILDENNIGLNGLIDKKSGLPLDLRVDKGQWVSTYSDPKTIPAMEGYRVCLLHFAHSPWVKWDTDVIYSMENTSKALFYNETLGLEYDAGSIPITREEIIRACNDDYVMSEEPDRQAIGRKSIMGIDYGPVNSDASHTVITIMQEREGVLQVVYAKKFLGAEASYAVIHEEVPKLMKKWNCILLASDYGMGEAPNSEFRNRLGFDKVMPYMYLPTQKEAIRYNPKSASYTINKNFMMNKFFNLVKKGKIKFPSWESFYQFAGDLQNVIVEYDEDKNSTRYTNIGPDDFVHSTIFAMITTMIIHQMGGEFV